MVIFSGFINKCYFKKILFTLLIFIYYYSINYRSRKRFKRHKLNFHRMRTRLPLKLFARMDQQKPQLPDLPAKDNRILKQQRCKRKNKLKKQHVE